MTYICARTVFTEITWLPNSLYEAKMTVLKTWQL